MDLPEVKAAPVGQGSPCSALVDYTNGCSGHRTMSKATDQYEKNHLVQHVPPAAGPQGW